MPGPTSTMMLREYILPGMAATAALPRHPAGITYDDEGYIWVTDFFYDKLYRFQPAINQSMIIGWEWHLPETLTKRIPEFIIVDNQDTAVWFCNRYSQQLSKLNYVTQSLTDYNLGAYNIDPYDLTQMSWGDVYLTSHNTSRFCRLNGSDFLDIYDIQMVGAPVGLAGITTNDTDIFLVDRILDLLYDAPLATFKTNGLEIYPLHPNGDSRLITLDSLNNIWVTQPKSDFIEEQLTGSRHKNNVSITQEGHQLYPDSVIVNVTQLEIPVIYTPIRGVSHYSPPNITGDPLATWAVPSSPSYPFGIACDSDDNAWFTQVADNKMGAIEVSTDTIWEYSIPTPNCVPLLVTITPNDHVWFTEYNVGIIGELYEDVITDVRVCPSQPPHYPPPSPGSIRWTWEPGAEIWIDAPSNGYSSLHHDAPEVSAINRVYARVKNLGSIPATNVIVKFYYHNMSLGFGEWIPLPPTAPSSGLWTFIDSVTITSLPTGMEQDVYVEWDISASLPTHQCLGVQVTYAGDMNLYDNVAYRNFNLVGTTAGSGLLFPLVIWNLQSIVGQVRIGISGVPEGWNAWITPDAFSLDPGVTEDLEFHVSIPASAQSGTQAIIHLTSTINGEVTGHVWYQITVKGTSEITCYASPAFVRVSDEVLISGDITPARSGAAVTLDISGAPPTGNVITTFTDSTGHYSVYLQILPGSTGTYLVTASWQGDTEYLGATSSPPALFSIAFFSFTMDLGLGLVTGVVFAVIVWGIWTFFRKRRT